jgi:putative restriction endonuclease
LHDWILPLQKRQIRGATHGSRAEENIWEEFHQNWDALAFESQRLTAQLKGVPPEALVPPEIFPEGKTREAIVKTRVNQAFFRSAVLAAYGCKCCVTGLSISELLTASHIVPWRSDIKNRTNPRNGLCLNAIHDKAFDSGLVTVGPDYRVRLSNALKRGGNLDDELHRCLLLRYEGQRIALPNRFVPDGVFLEYHNKHVFRDAQRA